MWGHEASSSQWNVGEVTHLAPRCGTLNNLWAPPLVMSLLQSAAGGIHLVAWGSRGGQSHQKKVPKWKECYPGKQPTQKALWCVLRE
jgi:hypothetical protein